MVTVTTSILTTDRIIMSRPTLVDVGSSLAATDTNFSWFTPSGDLNDVDIHGSGFTYSGSGDGRELASGTITSISIDIGNDNASETSGDLVITGTEGLIVTNIDKDDPNTFWNEVLKGHDTFNLTGFGEADVGLGGNTVFGDDLNSAGSSFSGITDQGGNDTILGGDNEFQLSGDVVRVAGSNSGIFIIFAEYAAGDDNLISAVTDRNVQLVGDAFEVDALGTLHGGNDLLDNSQGTSPNSSSFGDVFIQFGGVVNGGNDTISTPKNTTIGGGAAGDVASFRGGTLNGGDDVIEINGTSLQGVSGDVQSVTDTASGNIQGGNDRITGGSGQDSIGGEILSRDSSSVTVVGGDDTLVGGNGFDFLYGEVAIGSLAQLSGGNDHLFGGNADDQLFGQTGDDRLVGGADDDRLHGGNRNDVLFGGSGNDRLTGAQGDDRLTGEESRDLFIFGPNCDADILVDFTDTGGVEDDRIDARAFNLGSIAEIGKTAIGDDLLLNFGSGDTVRILDYLSDHGINQINDDILI